MPPIRTAAELADVDQPLWQRLRPVIEESEADVRILPVDPARGRDVLHRLQVTTRSGLGALACHTGGLVADDGWVRVLGGGGAGLPDLATVNGLGEPEPDTEPPGSLIVGFDVLGGRFAIDGGALGVAPGMVCHRGPGSPDWSGLGVGHTNWVEWVCEDGLAELYERLRWPDWRAEVSALSLAQGLSVFPPPFTVEGADVGRASRVPVEFDALLEFYDQVAVQFAPARVDPAVG